MLDFVSCTCRHELRGETVSRRSCASYLRRFSWPVIVGHAERYARARGGLSSIAHAAACGKRRGAYTEDITVTFLFEACVQPLHTGNTYFVHQARAPSRV
jgi:hypothetical protein